MVCGEFGAAIGSARKNALYKQCGAFLKIFLECSHRLVNAQNDENVRKMLRGVGFFGRYEEGMSCLGYCTRKELVAYLRDIKMPHHHRVLMNTRQMIDDHVLLMPISYQSYCMLAGFKIWRRASPGKYFSDITSTLFIGPSIKTQRITGILQPAGCSNHLIAAGSPEAALRLLSEYASLRIAPPKMMFAFKPRIRSEALHSVISFNRLIVCGGGRHVESLIRLAEQHEVPVVFIDNPITRDSSPSDIMYVVSQEQSGDALVAEDGESMFAYYPQWYKLQLNQQKKEDIQWEKEAESRNESRIFKPADKRPLRLYSTRPSKSKVRHPLDGHI
jgi:hypothetical protein